MMMRALCDSPDTDREQRQMDSPVSITLIVDNEAPPGFVAEHGFAAWIDAGDESFLFDTGQG